MRIRDEHGPGGPRAGPWLAAGRAVIFWPTLSENFRNNKQTASPSLQQRLLWSTALRLPIRNFQAILPLFSPHQKTTYTGQPRLNDRCYSGVWAIVADCGRAGPKLAEGRTGPQNGLEIAGQAGPKIFGPCASLVRIYMSNLIKTLWLQKFFWSVSGSGQVTCKIIFNCLVRPKLI